MIHEVVSEFAGAVGEAVGKVRCRGIEKDAGGLQRGSKKEKNAGLELKRGLGLRIDDTDTTDAAGLRIEHETVNDAVGTNGEAPGFLRGGQSFTEAAQIGIPYAAAVANTAVVAGGAALLDSPQPSPAAHCDYVVLHLFCAVHSRNPLSPNP